MNRFGWILLAALAGCSKPPPPEAAPEKLSFETLGSFEYKDKMKLPESVTQWNGKRVRATGFMNPISQTRNLTAFFLVRDRASCCYGKQPQITHYVDVKLKPGVKTDYSTEPVTVQGTLKVEDRWDGDWQLGLYWIEDAEVVK